MILNHYKGYLIILLSTCISLCGLQVSAKPGIRRPVRVVHPDGTVEMVVKKKDPYGHLRTNHRSVTRGPGRFDTSFPVTGEQKVLVILAEFQDVRFNSKNKAPYNSVDSYTYFSQMLNKKGFDMYGATGSARDWFEENSCGRFLPEFDVYGPVTLPEKMAFYGGNDRRGEEPAAYKMVVDACELLDSKIDFRDYDRNGDGYVDNVYLIYAGYGEADTVGEEDSVWPHQWTISAASPAYTGMIGMPITLDGVKIDHYACSNETCGIVEYDALGNGIYGNRPDGIGTFVHEFSHVLGLPDLYSNEIYSNYKDEPFTPGEFSVMDYGPYNNEGRTPPNYSSFERQALGWITPRDIKPGEMRLDNLADSNDALIVKTDKEDEFYLFENRQQSGWDEYLPGHGMLVWHVDYNSYAFINGSVNSDKNHQYIDLVEADGIQDYPIGKKGDEFVYPFSTRTGDPFPGSSSVTSFGAGTTPPLMAWSGYNPMVELTGITEKDGIISFSAVVNGDNAVEEVGIQEGGEIPELYDLQGRRIIGDAPTPGIYIMKTSAGAKKILIK